MIYGLLKRAQMEAPVDMARPDAPAQPQAVPQEPTKEPVREIKITDKQPNGSELSMVLKGDELQNDRLQFLLKAVVDSGIPPEGQIPQQPIQQQGY